MSIPGYQFSSPLPSRIETRMYKWQINRRWKFHVGDGRNISFHTIFSSTHVDGIKTRGYINVWNASTNVIKSSYFSRTRASKGIYSNVKYFEILFTIEYPFVISKENVMYIPYHFFQRDVSCLDLMRILLFGIQKQSLWLMLKTYCAETKIHLLTSEKSLWALWRGIKFEKLADI